MVPFITITLLLHLDACSKHKKYFRCFEYKLQKLFHTFFRCFRQYVFAVIDSKWKASIFNTYSDIWPSVHRYTYIIAILWHSAWSVTQHAHTLCVWNPCVMRNFLINTCFGDNKCSQNFFVYLLHYWLQGICLFLWMSSYVEGWSIVPTWF